MFLPAKSQICTRSMHFLFAHWYCNWGSHGFCRVAHNVMLFSSDPSPQLSVNYVKTIKINLGWKSKNKSIIIHIVIFKNFH
jgi:hypothetical protein